MQRPPLPFFSSVCISRQIPVNKNESSVYLSIFFFWQNEAEENLNCVFFFFLALIACALQLLNFFLFKVHLYPDFRQYFHIFVCHYWPM